MYQNLSIRRDIFISMILFAILFTLSFSIESQAISVSHYSYDSIYDALPKKYRDSTYIYKVNDIPYISFATYSNNGNYKTSLKKTKSSSNFLYCVDFSKHMTFQKNYKEKGSLFNNELRSRIGLALYLGTTSWGKQANAEYTTGNSILDYYMTQLVIHSLIYKYGAGKANYGIDYSKIDFMDNTAKLKKQTTSLYNFCCKKKITYSGGNFQGVSFSFNEPKDKLLYLENDKLISSNITCKTATDNAIVDKYTLDKSSNVLADNVFLINKVSDTYNSDFTIAIPNNEVSNLPLGVSTLTVKETVAFKRKLATFWFCSDSDYSDNQETGGLKTIDKSISDELTFEVLTGEVIVHKKDSITGETITDAVFDLLQYDENKKDYLYYKTLSYNPSLNKYESGNIFINVNNPQGKFKIIETKSGKNYINDWEGEYFQLTKNNFSFEYIVENSPQLGALHIEKKGEIYQDNTKENPLNNVKFGLYAAKDIYLKGTIYYPKDQKIVDIYTNKDGKADVNQLMVGDYYIKELSTNDKYITDSQKYNFSITRNADRKYNEVTLRLTNKLKSCNLKVYKYYVKGNQSDATHKLPIENVTFGLYAQKDITDALGNILYTKDSLLKEGKTDASGNLEFDNLLYADYYLKELKVPDNFILSDGIIPVSSSEFTLEKESYIAHKEILNQQQLFSFKLSKRGEYIDTIIKNASEYGFFYTYHTNTKPLESVYFNLYDTNMNLISQKQTNEKGLIYFSNLEPDKYYYIEDSCPKEYIKDDTKQLLECAVTKSNINNKITFDEISSDVSNNDAFSDFNKQILLEKEISNKLFQVTVSLQKAGEQTYISKKGLAYKSIPLKDVVFGLYQDFNYEINATTVIPKDTCLGFLVTDSDGTASFNGILPEGQYYLKELKTTIGYELSKDKYSFKVVPETNQNVNVTINQGAPILNNLSKAAVCIHKVDANTNKSLKNVEFTLYNVRDEKIGTYKTDKKGILLVDNLPYGDYYFIETKCKKGYYSSNNKYRFTINSSQTIELTITNTPILKLGFEEHYKGTLIAIGILLLIVGMLFSINLFTKRRI